MKFNITKIKNIIIYNNKYRKFLYIFIITFLTIIFTLIINIWLKNRKNEEKKDVFIINNTRVQKVDFSEKYKNKNEEKLIKEGKIKTFKIKTKKIIKSEGKKTLELSKNKKDIPERLVLSDKNKEINWKKDDLIKTKEEIIKNKGNFIYNEFMGELIRYNKNNKIRGISYKYNKFSVTKYKKQIINAIASYIVNNKDKKYNMKEYLKENKIIFSDFIERINGLLTDIIGKKLFILDLNTDLLNHIKFESIKNIIGIVGDKKIKDIQSELLSNIKENIKITNDQDREIFKDENYLIGILLNKNSNLFTKKYSNINGNESKYRTILTISTIVEYYKSKYGGIIKSENIINTVIKKVKQKIKNSNIDEWDKRELINLFK